MNHTDHRHSQVAPGTSRFHLRIGRSPIQGLGVFAEEDILPRRRVIEYTGARFTRRQLESRLAAIHARKGRMPRCLFRVGRNCYLDGGIGGGAERINHSCDPNLRVRKIRDRLFLFSTRRIHVGEELTYDYCYRPPSPRKICRCHSPKCRGTINVISKHPDLK